MTATLFLGMFLGLAFLLQGLLGFIQIKNFTKNYDDLRKNGQVLIGKNPKRFQSGTLLLLPIKSNGDIKDARIMKGVTIFAKFKTINSIKGQNIVELTTEYQTMKHFDKLTRGCLLNASKNYLNFKTGKLSYDDISTGVDLFSMPIFNKVTFTMRQLFAKGSSKI